MGFLGNIVDVAVNTVKMPISVTADALDAINDAGYGGKKTKKSETVKNLEELGDSTVKLITNLF